MPLPSSLTDASDRDIVHHVACAAAATSYATLGEPARDAARKSILDTLGVILAAGGLEPAVRGAIAIVEEGGGAEQCHVLGMQRRVPAVMAAFAHGALAHCLDYDDQTPWGQHAASSVVPAVFALAERQGGVSGEEMIAAVAVGQDVFARLRCNVGWLKDWNLSTVFGVFAATAAAGRVLNLPAEVIANAMGIASMQCAGIMQMVCGTGSDLRGLYAGFSAKGAVLATMMAQQGISGIDDLFEGQYGVFASYFGGRYDRGTILDGLGREHLGAGTLYKRWPAVGTAHSHMKAAIDIVTAHDLHVDDIAEVRLAVGDYHDLMCQPLSVRQAPATLVDAKFSLPFLVAVAIVRRGMSIADFTQAGLRDPAVLAVASRMTLDPDPTLDWTLDLPPGRVTIVARDGRHFTATGLRVPGGADNPMDWSDLSAKFAECAAVAIRPPDASRIAAAQAMARSLEREADATALLRLLA